MRTAGIGLEVELVASKAVELSESEVAAALESAARLKVDDDRSTRDTRARRAAHSDDRDRPRPRGVDTGAEGAAGAEKDIVLAVARELNRALLASGILRAWS